VLVKTEPYQRPSFASISVMISINFTSTAENETCQTPNQEAGDCIRFRECSSLFAIYQAKPVSDEDAKLIRDSKCGVASDGKPLVCCPSIDSPESDSGMDFAVDFRMNV
jgi:Regulatory CLIP domain of proteinases